MAELVKMRAQGVHRLSALFYELLARAKCDCACLLVGRLRLDEPHGRPQRRLDDGLGIGRVVLLALEERLDVVRRDQPDLMTLLLHLPRPVMGAGARLHRHATRRLLRHEPGELRPRQLLSE